MTREQLDLIPDRLISRQGNRDCMRLIEWLRARGWQMTLLELETERARRRAEQ